MTVTLHVRSLKNIDFTWVLLSLSGCLPLKPSHCAMSKSKVPMQRDRDGEEASSAGGGQA